MRTTGGCAALTHAKVLHGLAGVSLPPEEDGVGPGWSAECELVEGEGLPACVEDAFLCCAGVAEGCDREFGDVEEADVVCDRPDDDDGFGVAVGCVGCFLDYPRERDRWTVGFGEKEAVEDDLGDIQ